MEREWLPDGEPLREDAVKLKLWSQRSELEREERGKRADVLLRDDLLIEALDAIEEACVARWKVAQTPSVREDEWRNLEAARNVRRALSLIVQRGKEAATQRTLREKAEEKLRKMRGAA